jgi:excisionase family DNA binding protein
MTQAEVSQRRLAAISTAAERMDCSTKTVRRMIAAGELRAYRVGKQMIRVDLNEVDALARPIPTASA